MFRYVAPEQRVPADHPLRVLRPIVDAALQGLSGLFAAMEASDGRPSIPPEELLRALIVAACRKLGVTPHVAWHITNRRSAIDARTARHPGYAVSQRARKRVEEIFGWMRTIGLLRKARQRGLGRVSWMFTFTAAIYNLIRMRNLAAVVT